MKLELNSRGIIMTIRDPESPMEAANKNYVDNSLTTHANDATLHLTSGQNAFLDSVTASAAEVNFLTGVTSSVQTQIDSKVAKSGDTMTGLLTLSGAPTAANHAATKTYVDTADALKVAKAGDTMTGLLTLSGAPTAANHAATKTYVDTTVSTHAADQTLHVTSVQNTLLDGITVGFADINQLTGISSNVQTQINTKVAKAGDTMTGLLTLSGAPTVDLHAATKLYVDAGDALKVAKAGDTMTGLLTLSGAPTATSHAATKGYVDTTVSTHADDATVHLTSSQNAWIDAITATSTEVNYLSGTTSSVQTQINSKVAKSGDTMTGALTLPGAPTVDLHAATKKYVDDAAALKVAKSGDTMTGFLTLHAAPTTALHASTKGYVDNTVTTHSSNAALHLTTAQNTWIDAITATSAEVNYLTGVTSSVQTQINSKFNGSGGSISGDVTLAAGKTIFVTKAPATANEVTNKAYVDSLIKGQKWEDPIIDAGLTAVNLATPNAGFALGDTYIVGNAPTGAFAAFAPGTAVSYNGTTWVNLLNRVVKVGDRFGVAVRPLTSTLLANFDAGTITQLPGIPTTAVRRLVEVTVATPGAVTVVEYGEIQVGSSTLVYDSDAIDVGTTYTYVELTSTTFGWVVTNSSVNLKAGNGLTLTGNSIDVKTGKGLNIVNDAVDVIVDTATGLTFTTATGKDYVALKLDGATLSTSATGLRVAQTTLNDIADRVSKTGTSAITGTANFNTGSALNINYTINADSHAVNKLYVDTADAALQTQITAINTTVTSLNANPVTKSYVDTADALKVAKAGDTMTGLLTLSGAPTAANHAATKTYVDTTVSTHASNASLHITATQNTLLDAITVSSTEINTLTGVTSAVQTQINNKVAKAGDTMTGALTLSGAPTLANHAATKSYVDTADALKVAKAGDTMTGLLTLSAAPTADLHAATKKYVDDGLIAHSTDNDLHLTATQNAFLDGLTATATEANYLSGVTSSIQTQINGKVAKSGDTMTGALTLPAAPTLDLHAATKKYVDDAAALKINKAGDTMTGLLTLSGAPTAANHAATKTYVDTNLSTHATNATLHLSTSQNTWIDAITATSAEVNYLSGVTSAVQTQLNAKIAKAGDTMTGALTLSGAPTVDLHAATKKYVDDAVALEVNKAGDTMTGFLTLHAAPTTALHASTKGYVDTAVSTLSTSTTTSLGTKVSKAGDTMTGALTLSGAPTVDLHAATKKYVDDQVSGAVTTANTNLTTLQGQVTTLDTDVSTLKADPTTKTYVDQQLSAKLSLTGGAMTGYITLHASPSQAMHPATKQYVDAIAQGLQTKPAVRLATTVNIAATYANGTSGVDSTLTGTVNGALVVDGITPNVGDRILFRAQTTALQNGDYFVQQVGSATTPFIVKRAITLDQSREVPGSYFYVFDGATLKGTGWVSSVVNPSTFTIGTDAITINQFSGQGTLTAGNGLTLTGNTFAVGTASAARIVVNADSIDLATTGVTAATYTKVTVDAYGRVTAGSSPTTIAGYGITDAQGLNANLTGLSGISTAGIIVRDSTNVMTAKSLAVSGVGLSISNANGGATGNITITSNATNAATASTVVARDASGNFSASTITAALSGNATTATTLQTTRTFAATGDVTAAAVNFNGSANVSLTTVLANSGVTAGTYTKVTVDAKGRVTGASTPTTLAGAGITDGVTITTLNQKVADLEKAYNELYTYIMSRI